MLGIALANLFANNVAFAACLKYTNKVEISGKLTRRVFPGPPDFESIAGGDRPEDYFFLTMNKPLCVMAASKDPEEINVGVKQLKTIQLNLDDYKPFRPYLGRHVTLKGTLYGAVSAHYHTPVALTEVVLIGTKTTHQP